MWWPHLFFLGSRLEARWKEVWPRHEKKSRVRLKSQQPEPFFSRSDDSAVACFFLRCRAVATAVAVARAASCGTQRESPVNVRMSTCQSDGADLSPVNLSCPHV